MPSFDVVSKVNMQEVENAVNQTRKEVSQRYDFKGSKTEIRDEKDSMHIISDSDFKLKAVIDILQSKLIKRSVSLKFLEYGKIEPASGGLVKQLITIKKGINQDKGKEIIKYIKELDIKVQAQIQEMQVRVTGKKRDDLQAAIKELKEKDFNIELQFENFRD